MYNRKIKFNLKDGSDSKASTLGFCPCRNNGCTHACMSRGNAGCMRSCSGGFSFTD